MRVDEIQVFNCLLFADTCVTFVTFWENCRGGISSARNRKRSAGGKYSAPTKECKNCNLCYLFNQLKVDNGQLTVVDKIKSF